MGIQELLCWYQKKIGTYDKQQWEKTIEQRILHGLTHIHPMKTKPPKTEFIDLDLVRGSSFPKAKPKHGLTTVTRLATLRLFFLPLYSRWWVEQTSARVFALLLLLYILQLINISIYFHHSYKVNPTVEQYVSSSEIIIPICMMFILTIIHSQIVSTHTGPDKLTQGSKSRRTKIRRRRVHYSNIRSRNISPETKSSESSIDLQTEKSFREGAIRRMSSEQIRNRITARFELEKVDEPRKKKSANKLNVTNNVKFNLSKNSINNVPAAALTPPMDDDGFESFNGYGSSENGDETVTENEVNNVKALEMDKPECGENMDIVNVVQDLTVEINSAVQVQEIDNGPVVRSNDYSSGEQSDAESDGENRNGRAQDKERSSQSLTEVNTSTTEYLGITTNSEECSYSSEIDESDSQNEMNNNENIMWDYDLAPTVILSPSCAPSDRVSCTIWENREIKKADLSVLDISSAIIARVETMPETPDYFYTGVVLSILLALLPPICRLSETAWDTTDSNEMQFSVFELYSLIVKKFSGSIHALFDAAFGRTVWERTVMIIALIERGLLSCLFFFLLAVAERTFKQRFLYAKLFSHLTSSRRARKSELPHFRLNKVRNIKTWLSVRSYLKRRGPQRSVDVIVSTAFIITLLLLSFISMLLLKDSFVTFHSQYNFEAVVWCLGLGIFLLRFMTLGTKINRKNRNLSVLITEQINLYLQIEQKPHKKDKLMVANSVLKLAADLLKELESPFKISGLSANSYLYTITKVVILSALSGVLSEMLGFKVKLTNIK